MVDVEVRQAHSSRSTALRGELAESRSDAFAQDAGGQRAGRFPEIDGLRALAVLIGVPYHYDLLGMTGGYVAADVFFLISGFLITRIIVGQLSDQSFSFGVFYARRFRRLAPALLVSLAFWAILGCVVMTPLDLKAFAASLVAAVLACTNVLLWRTSGYFEEASESIPLLHTWTLGVEEQFYLLWPAVLWLISRRHASKVPLTAIASMSLGFFVLGRVLNLKPETAFYLTPFRVFEFGLGACLVWLEPFELRKTWLSEAFFGFGILLILGPALVYDSHTAFPGYAALVPIFGAACVIHAGRSSQLAAATLGNALMGLLGRASYSIYLYHWPLFVFFLYVVDEQPEAGARYGLMLASILVGLVSYAVIERPTGSTTRLSTRGVFRIFLPLAAGLLAFGALAFRLDGLPWRVRTPEAIERPVYGGDRYSWHGRVGAHGRSPSLVLYGDSAARQLLAGFDETLQPLGRAIQVISHPGCMSLPGLVNLSPARSQTSCLEQLEHLRRELAGNQAPLMLAYGWGKRIADRLGGDVLDPSSLDEQELPAYHARLLTALTNLHEEVGLGRPMVLVGNWPESHTKAGYFNCVNRPIHLVSGRCEETYLLKHDRSQRLNRALRKYAVGHRNVRFVDPFEALCAGDRCPRKIGHHLVYSDRTHLSEFGSRIVGKHILSELGMSGRQ